MATDPTLHDDISALSAEIHELSGKFSAKEVLAKKAAELAEEANDLSRTARNLLIGMAAVVLLLGVAVWQIHEITTCQAKFNKANELRTDLLTDYTVTRDAAMEGLVKARGLPNDEAIIGARDNWLRANWLLKRARELNPVPVYEEYCSPVLGVGDPKVPPARKPGPVPSSLLSHVGTPLP